MKQFNIGDKVRCIDETVCSILRINMSDTGIVISNPYSQYRKRWIKTSFDGTVIEIMDEHLGLVSRGSGKHKKYK